MVQEAFPIAGEFSLSGHGGSLDPKWTDLSTSPSSADREKEGIRLEMNGAPKQQAIIEFICDASARDRRRNVAGLSAAEDDEGDGGSGDGKEGEEVDDGQGGILKLLSWKVVEDTKVLSLEWTTEYACEHAKEGGEKKSSSGHWGFFTWFIIMWVCFSELSTPFPLPNAVSLSPSMLMLTLSLQSLHGGGSISNIRLMAQLHPLFSARLGPAPSFRNTTRYSIYAQGLDAAGRQYGARGWVKRWI